MNNLKSLLVVMSIFFLFDSNAESPELVVKTGKEIVIGAGKLSSSLDSKENARIISDHIISFRNIRQSIVKVNQKDKAGSVVEKTLLVSDAVSNARVKIFITSREYNDEFMKIKGSIWTNVPDVLIHERILINDGVRVPIDEYGEFKLSIFGESTLEASIISNGNILKKSERIVNALGGEDWGCDFYLESELLNAFCFSDTHELVDIAFVIDESRVGNYGEVIVNSENTLFGVYILFKTMTRRMNVQVINGEIDVEEAAENDISKRLSSLLRRPRKVY